MACGTDADESRRSLGHKSRNGAGINPRRAIHKREIMISYIHDDVEHWADNYAGEKFHAILCDPPYGLNEEELDTAEIMRAWLNDEHFTPERGGFMGRSWDSIVPGPRIWRGLRNHAYPGAYLFAFCGTRTADLLSIAIRLAGWEKVDEIQWCYGNGFPKNHNISKAIDRKAGAKGEVIATRKHQPKFDAEGFDYRKKDNGYNSKDRATFEERAPATDMARVWDGYGTALKPAHEPILVFRNPIIGTYAENAITTGAGGLNIEGARVGSDPISAHGGGQNKARIYGGGIGIPAIEAGANPHNGRYPANLILGHSPSCNDSGCVEGCAVARLGAQSGELTSGSIAGARKNISNTGYGSIQLGRAHIGDTGTAARFFQQIDWRLDLADPFIYIAKASTSERETGLSHLAPRIVNDGRDTPIDNAYQRGDTLRRNIHPTLKPIALAVYLATLLLPPVEYGPRRICVPFGGVGSEAIGCMLAGWEDVMAIEREAEYIPIGQARIEWWQANGAAHLKTRHPPLQAAPAVHTSETTARRAKASQRGAQTAVGQANDFKQLDIFTRND